MLWEAAACAAVTNDELRDILFRRLAESTDPMIVHHMTGSRLLHPKARLYADAAAGTHGLAGAIDTLSTRLRFPDEVHTKAEIIRAKYWRAITEVADAPLTDVMWRDETNIRLRRCLDVLAELRRN